MSAIDRCPSEIWMKIIGYACLDGGKTGCSLALTCKHFNALSKDFRLLSVAISSIASLDMFIHNAVKHSPETTLTHLRHLMLDLPSVPGRNAEHFEVAGILWTVAPKLQSLFLSPAAEDPLAYFAQYSPQFQLPLLEYLTAPCKCLEILPIHKNAPSLRRLRITHCQRTFRDGPASGPVGLLSGAVFPRLNSLLFTHVQDSQLPRRLSEFLEDADRQRASQSHPIPCLRIILVDIVHSEHTAWGAHVMQRYETTIDQLVTLEQQRVGGGLVPRVFFSTLEAMPAEKDRATERLKQEWFDYIANGDV